MGFIINGERVEDSELEEEVVEEDVESETQETSNSDAAGESTGTNESDSSSTSGGGMEGTQIDDGVGTETGEVPVNETPSGSGEETQEAPENEAAVLDSELFLEFRVMDLSAKEDLQDVNEEGTGLAGSGTFLSQYDFVQDSGDEPLSISAEFENLDSAISSLLPSTARFSSDAKWWVSGFDFETENVLWQKYGWSVHYGQAAWGERQEIRLVRKKGGQYEPIPINHPDIVRKYLAVERSRPLGSSETAGPHVAVESVSLKTLRIRSGQAKSVDDGQEPRDGTQVPGNPDEAAENLILDARVLENREVWVDLLPVEVEDEIFMFSGHDGDVVHLKIGGNPDIPNLEWRLKSQDGTVGTFSHATTTDAEFKALKPATDEIELVIDGKVVWAADLEILEIISRSGWGARAPDSTISTAGTIFGDSLTYHHSSKAGNTGAEEARRIQDLHMDEGIYAFIPGVGNDWPDIGYHYLIDKAGKVYEGRSLESTPGKSGGPFTKGTHVAGANTVAGIGICIMGDFEKTEGNEAFTATVQKNLEKVLIATCRRYEIPRENLSYHSARALASSPSLCPGSNAIPKASKVKENVTNNLQYDE